MAWFLLQNSFLKKLHETLGQKNSSIKNNLNRIQIDWVIEEREKNARHSFKKISETKPAESVTDDEHKTVVLMRHFQLERELWRHLVLCSIMNLLCGERITKRVSLLSCRCFSFVCGFGFDTAGGGEVLCSIVAIRCCCCCSNWIRWTFSVKAYHSWVHHMKKKFKKKVRKSFFNFWQLVLNGVKMFWINEFSLPFKEPSAMLFCYQKEKKHLFEIKTTFGQCPKTGLQLIIIITVTAACHCNPFYT